MAREFQNQFPFPGRVEWIGLRPARGQPMVVVPAAEVSVASGLHGDFFRGTPSAPRQVTLIQAEHLEVIGTLLKQAPIDPALTRRNIVVSGINLKALLDTTFQIGTAILKTTGDCAPCGQMEENLGPGGYNAMRTHGGITACVVQDGHIQVGDQVFPCLLPSS